MHVCKYVCTYLCITHSKTQFSIPSSGEHFCTYIGICVYVYVGMHIYRHICTYTGMYANMLICRGICTYTGECARMHVCMHVCVYICTVCNYATNIPFLAAYKSSIYVRTCVCMYLCIYAAYACMHACMHTMHHTFPGSIQIALTALGAPGAPDTHICF
jgi:hypothetical protein